MPDMYRAPVLNMSEADFMRASEEAEYEGPESVQAMRQSLQERALGLNNYLARYIRDIVIPFNTDSTTRQIAPGGSTNVTAFRTGAFMAFTMVDGVRRTTGAELPSFDADDIEPADPHALRFESNARKHIIDLFFRGSEMRERMPHIYRPTLLLMGEVVQDPIGQLTADMDTPFQAHRHPDIAFSELHFLGGAAEVVLTIEDRAARETAQ